MASPLRASLGLQIAAALLSTIGVLGLGLLRGELADRELLRGAWEIEARVVAVDANGGTVAYEVDGVEHRAVLEDRAPGERSVGDAVRVEVPRADPGRALHRVSRGDLTLPIGLLVLGLTLGVGCTIAAWRMRRRCALLPARRRPVWQRVLAAGFELAIAASFLLVWFAPQRVPIGLAEQTGNALRFEALLLVLMSFAAPMLLEARQRVRDALLALAVVIVAVLLADFIAQGEGDWVWGLLATLLVARGWPLFEPDRARRLHLAERWSAALVALLGTWWLCVGLLGWLPLPAPGAAIDASVAQRLPAASTLLWGACHFTLQAVMQWFDWPRARADAHAIVARAGTAAPAVR